MSETQSYKTVTLDHDEWSAVKRGLEARIEHLGKQVAMFGGAPGCEKEVNVLHEFTASAERALEKVDGAARSEGLKK